MIYFAVLRGVCGSAARSCRVRWRKASHVVAKLTGIALVILNRSTRRVSPWRDSTHAFNLKYVILCITKICRANRDCSSLVSFVSRVVAFRGSGRSTMAFHYGVFPGLLHADTMQSTPRPMAQGMSPLFTCATACKYFL